MRRTRYFLPTLKETPAEAEIVSHRLMLRAGMIRQASAGIYSWLPLGIRVLKNVERIVREEQDATGAQEVLMPTIQSAELWKQSGRYDDYGKEMLRIEDRHGREMLYGPTNEELITDIFKASARSYRDLPKNLYHIQWKFRDEVRPRFGVMRGREFLMKDAYSFDIDFEGARRSYNKMFVAYLRTFARMGMQAIPMEADSGPIGGDMSHEFQILADTGESEIYCHRDFVEFDVLGSSVDYEGDLQAIVDHWTSLYAAPTTSTTRRASRPRCRRRGALFTAASKSGTSSISAPNIPSPWAPRSPIGMASPWRSIWARTVSGSRACRAPSSRRATTTLASSGPNRWRPSGSGSSICGSGTRPATRPARTHTPSCSARAPRCSTATARSGRAPNSPRWT